MQFIRAISDHLFSSPPQPRATSPPLLNPPLPSSNTASEPPVRNELASVPKGSEFALFDPFTEQLSPHSYANSFEPDRRSPSVRRLLRKSIPHPGLGMPKLSRERDPIRKGASSVDADEYRLLGGSKQQDPHGVPIIPGQTANAKKKNINIRGFRPHDSLSKGSRSSGPVRARGKEKEQYFSSPSRPKHSTNIPERSSKRRRVESPEETPKRRTTTGEEASDRSPARRSPSVIRLDARSPTPSQLSSQAKEQRDTDSGRASVHRTSDKDARNPKSSPKKSTNHHHRFSSDDEDLSFTRDAAKERQKGPTFTAEDFEFAPRKLPEQTSNLSVEIVKRPSIPDDSAAQSPPPRRTGKARAPYSRESPDELQGEVTVKPVPTSLSNPRRDLPSTNPSSDIRPTVFISSEKPKRGHKNKKENSSKKRHPASQRFKILYYRGTPWLLDDLGAETDQLIVDPADGEITIKIANSGIVRSISLKTVLKVLVGDTPSRKVRFELSKVEGQDTKLDLELSSSEEKKGLCSLLEKLKVDVREKEEEYIDRIFKKSERDHKHFAGTTNGHKRPLELVEETGEAPNPPSGTAKRMRLSDALQHKDENLYVQTSSKTASEKRNSPSFPAITHDEIPNPSRASSPSSGPQHSIGVEIPVKKSDQNLQTPTRSTRSMARQVPTTLVCDDDEGPGEGYTLELDHGVDKKMNKKPLVYPRFGKKKAEVNALDLERLAPHEFLNDNIIGFYIRFLEDHLQRCNAEVAKRVYFFNSYFFARLTNSPRGRRSVNYEGVEKWTRSVDLFSYDYVVVPINEDAHWYLAIICNLPYLEGIMDQSKPPASQQLSDTQEIPETPEPSLYGQERARQTTKEETIRQSLASMDMSDKQGAHEKGSKRGEEDWPEHAENPDPTPAKFSDFSSQTQPDSQKSAGSPKKSRKSKKRPPAGMKYDACQPIVITFDSLNQSRSSTISHLREYLFAEAKSKRGIEINKTMIKGMTAKEIPQQPNFSDCGLYLLAYLEKFVQDPDVFARRLLRKEMRSIEDWPPLQSGLLRTRLRKFMELLYNEQEQLTKAKADKDMLMVDQQPISYLLGTPATDVMKEKVKNQKNSPDVQVERSPPLSAKATKHARSREPSVQPRSPEPDIPHGQDTANAETQESVVLIDHKPRPHSTSPRRDAQDQHAKRVVVEVPDSQDQAKAPSTDAAQIIEHRSPQQQRKRADPVYVDDGDVVEDSAPQRKETGARRAESADVEIQVRGTPPPNVR